MAQRIVLQDAAAAEPEPQPEPNLLDLDDLNLSEPSPANLTTPENAANGFGSDYASPPGTLPTQSNTLFNLTFSDQGLPS